MSGLLSSEVQRLWLDARCTSGSSQHQDKVTSFLQAFLSGFESRRDEKFRMNFGNGSDLVTFVCKEMSESAKRFLNKVGGAPTKHDLDLALVSTLMLLAQHKCYPTAELGALASTYESFGIYNLVSLLLMIHAKNVEEKCPPNAADSLRLQLIDIILTCPTRRLIEKSIHEACQERYITLMASTLATGYTGTSSQHSNLEVVEAAAKVFSSQIKYQHAPDKLSAAVLVLEGAIEAGSPTRVNTNTTIALLLCILESILLVRNRFGFYCPETISFPALMATMLSWNSSQADGSPDRSSLCMRMASALKKLALAPRKTLAQPSGSTAPTPKGALGFLQMVPGTLSKIQQKIVGTIIPEALRDNSPIQCPEAVECLCALFICTDAVQLLPIFGEVLFGLLPLAPVDSGVARFTIRSCVDAFDTLNTTHLRMFFDFLLVWCDQHEIEKDVRDIIEKYNCAKQEEMPRITTVIDFLTTYCAKKPNKAAVVLMGGFITASLKKYSGTMEEDPMASLSIIEKVAVLSKVVVTSSEAAPILEEHGTPKELLTAMLNTIRTGSATEASVIMRDMLTGMILRTGRFHQHIIAAIAELTDSNPWSNEATPLLATLVAALQTGKHAEEAIKSSAIELCFALIHSVDCSAHPPFDLHLLGCCLSFLLPSVRYSDVWALFDSSVATINDNVHATQFMIDLCCGFYRTPGSLALCNKLFESSQPLSEQDLRRDFDSCGGYWIPEKPFCELTHPLQTLVQWADRQLSQDVDGAADLVSAVELLLLRCGVKLPNHSIVSFVRKWGKPQLLSCVEDVVSDELLSFFFGGEATLSAVHNKQEAWLAALGDEQEHRYYVELSETGGASGVVNCTGEAWPPSEGYSVATWVHWTSASSSEPTDRKNTIWQLSWEVGGTEFSASLLVNPKQEKCFYVFKEGAVLTSIELPYIPPRQWIHVATCHCGKLFGSPLQVFYNGVLIVSARCPYPSNALQSAISMTTALASVPSRDITCTIGSIRKAPNSKMALRFISFLLYSAVLSEKEVAALYSCGPTNGGDFWNISGSIDTSLKAPFLCKEVLRAMHVHCQDGSLLSVCHEQQISVGPSPSRRPVLHLNVKCMTTVCNQLVYMDNSRWTFLNCDDLSLQGSQFPLYGSHTLPQSGTGNEANALLHNGGLHEWLTWMGVIGSSSSVEEEDLIRARISAERLLAIVAAVRERSQLSPLVWRRFIDCLATHIIAHPLVYLISDTTFPALLRLSTCTIGTEVVLCSTTPIANIFFNWRVVANLPVTSIAKMINVLQELLSDSNSFRILNASRLQAAEFFNGFVCGMFREYVPHAALVHCMRLISRMLRILWWDSNFVSDLLSLCALSISEGSANVGIGSKLGIIARSYIVLLCNLLLRAVNDAWDDISTVDRPRFAKVLSQVLSPCWFVTITSRQAHPVSAALAMRLFVICFHHSEAFRAAFKGTRCSYLVDSLGFHAHHQEVMDIVIQGLHGQVWNGWESRKALASLQHVTVNEELTPLLGIALHLVKKQSQILLCGEAVAESSPPLSLQTYFDDVIQCRSDASVSRRRWKRCLLAILACVRIKRYSNECNSGLLLLGQTTKTVLAGNATQCSALVKEAMCEALDWMTHVYRQSVAVRKALYRSDEFSNLIDTMSWPLIVALHPQDVVNSPDRAADAGMSSDQLQDADADADDDDWDFLPAVVSVESRSYDLESMAPGAGMELVYDSCRSLWLAHAIERVTGSEEFALSRGRARMSKFVLSLHRALSAEQHGVGSQVESSRAGFLCTVWVKAAEHSIDTMQGHGSVVKNVLALGKYLLDRLVSGSPVPLSVLASFFRFMLVRLEENVEVVKFARTALLEWLMYVMDPSFYRRDGARSAGVVELIYPAGDILFGRPMPVAELLRALLYRLMELTHTCLAASGNLLESSTMKKLASLWMLFMNANKEATCLPSALMASGKDLFNGGFNLLTPPFSSVEMFLQWLQNNRADLWRGFQNAPVDFNFVVAEGGKYIRIMRKTSIAYQNQLSADTKLLADWRKQCGAMWDAFTDTLTFIDASVLHQGRAEMANNCIIIPTGQNDELSCSGGDQFWYLHPSGVTGLRAVSPSGSIDTVTSEPLSHYVRYAPLVCVPFRDSLQNYSISNLRPNALSILANIAGFSPFGEENALQWIGNAYFLVGHDSLMCTLTVTAKEIIIISCSEVTKGGDFFIAHVRPHVATQKSHLKAKFMQEAIRRFLPGQSSAPVTSSKAAFRHSQYYRQLRAEASQGMKPLVWRFPLGSIASIHQRLFQHMPAGIEFVLETGERFFAVVLDEELSLSKTMRDKVQAVVSNLSPDAVVETMGSKRNQLSSITRRWVGREISNAAYLSAVNEAASRTVADIGQYPVMPWILSDYTSSLISLDDSTIYRDLSKPVGAINSAKAEQLRRRYTEWLLDSEPPFHYGTHYSSSAIVLYYLIRLQPFTSRSIGYQGGRLDLADRLFHSLAEAWESSSGSGSGDVKELIPEFFFLPGFLKNRNHVLLGTRRDGEVLNDVALPPWSAGQPHVFTHMNSLALESESVSAHLNEWIDLIFGVKQNGEEAVSALNVFNHLSYQEGVERAISRAATEEDRKSIVASADNFGQTPPQLFNRSHPRRITSSGILTKQQFLIDTVQEVYSNNALPATKVGYSQPYTRLHIVDFTLYCCAAHTQIVGGNRSIRFDYIPRTSEIGWRPLRQQRFTGVLPPVESLGCGTFVCMAASVSGNFLCVGTAYGKVIVFSRGSSSEHFSVSAVLHSSRGASNPVFCIKHFEEGKLLVSHSHDSLVTAWHYSHTATMLCFRTHVRDEANSDSTPVRDITRDDQRGIYFGVKDKSIVVFSADGSYLTSIPVMEPMAAVCQDQPIPIQDVPVITCATFANMSSFHKSNLLLIGHRNGILSFWIIEAVTATEESEFPFYTAHLHHSLVLQGEIASIVIHQDGFLIAVGFSNGETAQLCYPHPDDDDTDAPEF